MIGLVLVTHGGLAREFIQALEHVVGAQPAMAAICIQADDDMETRRQEIADAIEEVDDGAGVIVLTDMFGGTPSNLAISLMGSGRARAVEVIAGVNLPMLIRLASVRGDMNPADAIEAAQEAGRKYISVASKILGEVA
ncbi:MAG: PTS sugar transporter subunit IIA [Pseudomonadota bacterium]